MIDETNSILLYKGQNSRNWYAKSPFDGRVNNIGCYQVPGYLGAPSSAKRVYISLRKKRDAPGLIKVHRCEKAIKVGRGLLYAAGAERLAEFLGLEIGEVAYVEAVYV